MPRIRKSSSNQPGCWAGGDLVLGKTEVSLRPNWAGTNLAGALERLVHVEELRLESSTSSCATMSWGFHSEYVMNSVAALNILDSQVTTTCIPRHWHGEFLRFLKLIDHLTPPL